MKQYMNLNKYYYSGNLEGEKWKVKYEIMYLKARKVLKNIANYVLI